MATATKRVALVTGAAQGMGRDIALKLADDGFDVAVNDIAAKDDNLDQVVAEIRAKGRSSSKHIADVSVDAQVREMVEQVVTQHGGLDVMVSNAGVLGRPLSIVDAPVEEWERVMSINSRGPFLCYKYAGAQMIKQGRGGRIIGSSSLVGKQGMANQAAYSSSKFAVRGLTQAAALELGPHGITVNAYAPGAIDTPMLRGADAAIIAQMKEAAPLKRIGTTQDMASLVSFLASKDSGFITGGFGSLFQSFRAGLIFLCLPQIGQTISINGGLYFD